MRAMQGKVGLVTGAGSGIGRASALALAREGAAVVVSDIDVAGGEETAQSIAEAGGTAAFQQTDISDERQVKALVDRTVQEYGSLDFAHNNAGVPGNISPLADCDRETWDRSLAVNLTGAWLCLRNEIATMKESGGGAIVNTASTFGVVGTPNMCCYVATKHGVVGLTRSAALDYAASGIRVNAVCPGPIDTPMMDTLLAEIGGEENVDATATEFLKAEPIARMGRPAEIGEAVLWLCSDGASFVTGQAIPIDGGWTTQ